MSATPSPLKSPGTGTSVPRPEATTSAEPAGDCGSIAVRELMARSQPVSAVS
jgi:hypothetical protein